MTRYEKPILEIVEIKSEDIVCTSPGGLKPGFNGEGPWV